MEWKKKLHNQILRRGVIMVYIEQTLDNLNKTENMSEDNDGI